MRIGEAERFRRRRASRGAAGEPASFAVAAVFSMPVFLSVPMFFSVPDWLALGIAPPCSPGLSRPMALPWATCNLLHLNQAALYTIRRGPNSGTLAAWRRPVWAESFASDVE
jgi:hypothetical protein